MKQSKRRKNRPAAQRVILDQKSLKLSEIDPKLIEAHARTEGITVDEVMARIKAGELLAAHARSLWEGGLSRRREG